MTCMEKLNKKEKKTFSEEISILKREKELFFLWEAFVIFFSLG